MGQGLQGRQPEERREPWEWQQWRARRPPPPPPSAMGAMVTVVVVLMLTLLLVDDFARERIASELMWKSVRATLKTAGVPTRNSASHTLRAVCVGSRVQKEHMNHSGRIFGGCV